ncbi:MAG: pyridoxal phosphate-dependent aminotransferase family protein, partial [Alphaproteobacteria bacterium]|nr:pyridoxal phosphate-dependent aminotransferase family protein [Alphaproteobacteria bacterium]
QKRMPSSMDSMNPLLGLNITSMKGRHIIDDSNHHLIDFSTQGYLGFDIHPAIVDAQISGLKKYGNVVPWSRTVGVFDIFTEVEKRLADLVRAPSANIFLSTTLLNHGVIPALAGHTDALIAFEKSSHMSSYEGALLAKEKGATLCTWRTTNDLDALLQGSTHSTKLIITDGVNSMNGSYADIPALDLLTKKHKTLLYIDDAHGFGVVGENPSPDYPYGKRGNGLVRYFGCDYETILYVGCFSKAYGLPGAFIACSAPMKEFLLHHATPHDLGISGQGSVMMGLLKAMDINDDDGDHRRQKLFEMTHFIQSQLSSLSPSLSIYQKTTPFPIISIALPNNSLFLKACRTLYEQGILVTAEPSHSHHKDSVNLLRITLTHGLIHKDLRALIDAFKKI